MSISNVTYDRIVGKSKANRYEIATLDDIEDRRKRKKEESDSSKVEAAIKALEKRTAVLTPMNLAKVALKQNNTKQAQQAGLNSNQADHVVDSSIFASTLAPALAGLTAINQIRRSRITEELGNKQNDNYNKALMLGTKGASFGQLAPGLAASSLRQTMNSALNFGGLMSMYELLTKHKLTGLSTEPLSYGNPGLIAAKLFGGIPGMGNAMIGGAGHLMNGAGNVSGLHGLNSVGGSLLGTAAGFDPKTASILSAEGVLGGMGTVGVGILFNKFLKGITDKSILNTSKSTRNKWNQQRYQFPNEQSHRAIQQYGLALANIKSGLSNGSISSGEAQQLATLEKIVFNTAPITDIFTQLHDAKRLTKNNNVATLNYVDKNIGDMDLSGKNLRNLFANDRMNKAQGAFFQTIGFLNSLNNAVNIVPNLFKSMKGQATDETFWKYREAKQGYDKDAPLKQLDDGNDLSVRRLLYATNLKTLIGNSKDPGLTAAITSAILLQVIAQKASNGKKNILGELNRLETLQDEMLQKKQDWFIDIVVKSVDKTLQKTPIIGAIMPAIHTLVGVGKMAKGIFNFANNITDPKYAKGFTGFFTDMRKTVIDSLRSDKVKSEATMRAHLKLTKKTKQELVADYFAGRFQDQMQELLELMGSNREPLYQDQYTGNFVTRKEAEKLRNRRAKRVDRLMGEFDDPDSLTGKVGNWFKKKLFMVNEDTLKRSSRKMKHVSGLVKEFREPKDNSSNTSSNLNVKSFSGTTFTGSINNMVKGIGLLTLASYQLFAGYLPYLKEIAECCPERKKKLKSTNQSGIAFLGSNRESGYGNTQDLINQTKSQDLASRFFSTMFEHIPNITKILEYISKKEVKSGMKLTDDKSKTNPNNKGILGTVIDWVSDMFDIDIGGRRDKNPKKGKWSRLKDFARDKASSAKDYGKGKWNTTKGFVSTGMDIAKNGLSKGSTLLRGGGAVLLRGGAMALSGIASLIGGIGALPALAIGTILATAADFIFNDGKITKSIWNSVKDSEFGKMLGEGVETLVKGWSDLKTWISDGITNMLTTIGDSIDSAFTSIKDGVYGGLYKVTGFDYFKEKLDESAANTAQRNDTRRQEADIKDMKAKIQGAKSENERLQIALSYKDRVSGASFQETMDSILNSKMQSQEKAFGKSMTWQNMQEQIGNLASMDTNKRDEMIRGYSELKSMKESSGLVTPEDKASYQKVDEMIRKIKEDVRKEYELKNPVDKSKEQTALTESLKQMQDTNTLMASQMQQMIKESSTVNGVMLKGFTEQINSLSGNQSNISNMMNMTAKMMQKPNVITLDTTVAKLIPAIN